MLSKPPAIKPLGQAQLGVALTTIYTCPSDPPNIVTRVKAIWICNTDTGAGHTCTLRVGTGVLTVANSLAEAWALDKAVSFVVSGPSEDGIVSLTAGQVLQGLSDTGAKITVSVYGDEVR